MINKRDGFIDFFKGLFILWVIQIHTVFWSGTKYIPDQARELSLLIDICVFFFISGYLTRIQPFSDACQKAIKQFRFLYFNYLALSLLLLPFLYAFNIFLGNRPDLVQAVLSMLMVNPQGEVWRDLPVYPGSLWYIAVYLSLLIISPFVLPLLNSLQARVIALITCFVLFAVADVLNWTHAFLFTEDVYIYFYLLIFLLGVVYRADENLVSTRQLKFLFIANITVCLLVFFFAQGGILELQTNKFPPRLVYLPYGLLSIQLFLLGKRLWNYASNTQFKKVCEMIEWCGKNSYFIYLFQGVICSLPGYFLGRLIDQELPIVVIYLITLLFNLVVTLATTIFYFQVRSFLSSRFSAFASKKTV